ncbi:MAG: nicotinate-nucleotide diphosphorylase (carboxylating), partial [Proteobacteria bacterium]|nr:nicotinate-nucleotide diphosphorylase (carboxylating) [Pseudomonadota bacterium]
MIEPLPDLLIAPVVRAALAEDLGRAGDVTAQACVPAEARLSAIFRTRRDGVVSGLACARLAIAELDPAAEVRLTVQDGDQVAAGTTLAVVDANARSLLSAERTALNLLGRLCGIATLTAQYVRAVEGTGALIVDTRKTTPGLRALEKY